MLADYNAFYPRVILKIVEVKRVRWIYLVLFIYFDYLTKEIKLISRVCGKYHMD